MGNNDSKEETKTVDTTGNVNNNVIIGEPVKIHSNEIIMLLYIICAVKIIELILFFYKVHLKRVKKKYLKANNDSC